MTKRRVKVTLVVAAAALYLASIAGSINLFVTNHSTWWNVSALTVFDVGSAVFVLVTLYYADRVIRSIACVFTRIGDWYDRLPDR